MRLPSNSVERASIAPLLFALTIFLVPPIFGADDLVAALTPSGAESGGQASTVDLDWPPLSLQDLFDFGELGPPLGYPGSTPIGDADQAVLDAALRDSERSPLADPDDVSTVSLGGRVIANRSR